MKSIVLLPVLFFILAGCSKNDPEAQKRFLNGYWEIKQVQSPYAEDKEYTINESMDYIEINDSVGFRAKVLPRFDGTIVTNGNHETIILKMKDDSLRLYYSTAYAKWTETVLQATEETLKVKNERGMIYTYARHELINVTEE